LLAGLGWERAEPLLAASDRRSPTANTIVDIDELRAELSRVAEFGYAVDDEERVRGVRCAAAPIRDATGGVVAALSVAGPALRLKARFTSAIAAVRDVAASASASLGYSDFAHHAVGDR
jgi:DNA-binding IclR family transcriptional regulator